MPIENNIQYIKNNTTNNKHNICSFPVINAKDISAFHRSFPEYRQTPLVNLKHLARRYGIQGIYIKDESYRFGQNAFKVLGGSYAIAKYVAKKLQMDISELTYEKLISSEIKEKLGEITFITATDGNHGRGIAWTANRLQQKCVVYMPKGTAVERFENIQKLGAKTYVMECNYDDCVRLAAEHAQKYGWVLVQDTAFESYEEIPFWIMQGYLTMIEETVNQLNNVVPTHVFLQAGVGAMAGSITAYLAAYYGKDKPTIIIVEPNNADCIFRTGKANDGKLHHVGGDLNTIMAGLACGEPCSIGWDIMKAYADFFVSIPDYIAAQGMRILSSPMKGDDRVISGESGAAGFGLAVQLVRDRNFIDLKNEIGIDENSVVLCISTEGDTDKENYEKIIWDGLYSS